MKQPASYRVIKYWKKVELAGLPFHTVYTLIPETKVRSDEMSDPQFDAIVVAVKEAKLSYQLYTVAKEMAETSDDLKEKAA